MSLLHKISVGEMTIILISAKEPFFFQEGSEVRYGEASLSNLSPKGDQR